MRVTKAKRLLMAEILPKNLTHTCSAETGREVMRRRRGDGNGLSVARLEGSTTDVYYTLNNATGRA